jgi:hypothetical protein
MAMEFSLLFDIGMELLLLLCEKELDHFTKENDKEKK